MAKDYQELLFLDWGRFLDDVLLQRILRQEDLSDSVSPSVDCREILIHLLTSSERTYGSDSHAFDGLDSRFQTIIHTFRGVPRRAFICELHTDRLFGGSDKLFKRWLSDNMLPSVLDYFHRCDDGFYTWQNCFDNLLDYGFRLHEIGQLHFGEIMTSTYTNDFCRCILIIMTTSGFSPSFECR